MSDIIAVGVAIISVYRIQNRHDSKGLFKNSTRVPLAT